MLQKRAPFTSIKKTHFFIYFHQENSGGKIWHLKTGIIELKIEERKIMLAVVLERTFQKTYERGLLGNALKVKKKKIELNITLSINLYS